MKIKFNSGDDLPLKKSLELHNIIIVVRTEDKKYYPQDFLDECLHKLQMLYYDRTDASQGIDANKTNTSKECDICHYCFLDKGFKFELYVYNGWHDLSMTSINLNDLTNEPL